MSTACYQSATTLQINANNAADNALFRPVVVPVTYYYYYVHLCIHLFKRDYLGEKKHPKKHF